MLLYEQIEQNKKKTWFIVGGFILFIFLIGSIISYTQAGHFLSGGIIALVFCLIYVPISLFKSNQIVMRMNHAKEITRKEDQPHLWHTVENLSMVARIPTPKIYIIHDPSPNAFAAGMKPENASVAVTTGLLDTLNREEVEAVIAHEIAHIRNYDVRLSTIALALVAVVAVISDLGSRFLIYGRNRKVHPAIYIVALILIILAPLVAMLIQLAISRNREFLADASGAELCRNPNALASALEKITQTETPVNEASHASASMYFADPLKKKVKEKASNVFSTHPSPKERIKRLTQM